MINKFTALLFIFGFILLAKVQVIAQFSPGDLSRSHQHLSGLKNCTQCHILGEGEKPVDEKCLECHTPLANRVNQGKGYHSQVKEECASCHPEHAGNEFDLIFWEEEQENFDHAKTGYVLKGKHTELKCEKCHTDEYITDEAVQKWEAEHADQSQTMTFLGLPTTCLGCHEDYHQEQLTETCTNCHTQDAWKPAKNFDHATADYTLIGKHQDVKCEECHEEKILTPGQESTVQFVDLDYRECTACHDDIHKGQFGENCTKCHTPKGWKIITEGEFNHDLTQYRLRGKHKTVDCEDCHTPGEPYKPLAHENCTDCHDDYHKGQFAKREGGINCESCHTVRGFTPAKFTARDHEETDFSLSGAHAAQPCIFCHEKTPQLGTEQFIWDPLRCTSCHEDEHEGQFEEQVRNDDCTACHRVTRWADLNFTHEDTEFPLRGEHRTVECAECHKPMEPANQGSPIQYTNIETDCQGCHDDIHVGQFAEGAEETVDCEKCHSPKSWKSLQFDHNSMSRFSVKGKHSDVACADCHQPEETTDGKEFIRYKPLGRACQECHTFSEM